MWVGFESCGFDQSTAPDIYTFHLKFVLIKQTHKPNRKKEAAASGARVFSPPG